MKPSLVAFKMKYWVTLLVLALIQTVVFAQTETTESSSSKTKVTISEETPSDWYTQPWVWIVGAAVFLLLLIALLRGGGGDRTVTHTYKEKVVRDRDTDADRV